VLSQKKMGFLRWLFCSSFRVTEKEEERPLVAEVDHSDDHVRSLVRMLEEHVSANTLILQVSGAHIAQLQNRIEELETKAAELIRQNEELKETKRTAEKSSHDLFTQFRIAQKEIKELRAKCVQGAAPDELSLAMACVDEVFKDRNYDYECNIVPYWHSLF